MKLSLLLAVTGLLSCAFLKSSHIAALARAQSNTLPTCPTNVISWGNLTMSPFFEDDLTLFLPSPSGLFRSTDGDSTWDRVFELPSDHWPRRVHIAPIRGATGLDVYFSFVEGTGNYPPLYSTRSMDSGSTWVTPWPEQLTDSCQQEGMTNEPGMLFSSCYTLWPLQGDPSIDGIHRSIDHGYTWERVWAGGRGVRDVTPSPNFSNDRTVFAVRFGFYPDANHYPMVSTDSGATWHDLSFGLCPVQSNANIRDLIVSPSFADDQTLFGRTNNDHLLKSEDGGLTWRNVYPANQAVCEYAEDSIWEVALSPDYAIDRTIFMKRSSGLYVSYDDGEHWHQLLEEWIDSIQVRQRPGIARQSVYLPLLMRSTVQAITPHFRQFLPLVLQFDELLHRTPLTLIASEYHDYHFYYYRSDDGGLTWRCLNLPPS